MEPTQMGQHRDKPAISLMQRQWLARNWLARYRTALICCAVVLGTVAHYFLRDSISWAKEEWMHERNQCQSTLFQPFRVGCPASCKRAIGNETMYRLNAAWYFGQSIVFEESQLPLAYDMGINYQAPRQYIENFVAASKRLGEEAKTKLPNNISVNPQARVHMSLAYFCCLRKDETEKLREIMEEWIQEQAPFDFTVSFNKLECWHERHNSVTNIMVGDDATQKQVMKLVHDLYKTIERHGIPMEVLREDQMPIHATLVGLSYGKGEGGQPQDDIRPHLEAIHDIVAPISKYYGDSWTGSESRMRVTHNPRYSPKGKWHAGVKP